MSLLIKDVQVVDGTGSEPYKADVLVQGSTISAIGNLKARDANRTIDGLGHYLTPGFIDAYTAADHYLGIFLNPHQEQYTAQGVTTIIGGHCGSSLAPLLYGTLESIRKWADPAEINVNWHTVQDFFKALSKIPIGVNFATFAGHSTIRRAIAGDRTRLQNQEFEVFKYVLRQAIKDGALGLSTGLAYVHGRSASRSELARIMEVLKETNGVYATHLRAEGKNLVSSTEEVIKLAEETGIKTVISHFRSVKGFEKEFEEAWRKIEDSPAQVYVTVYPYETTTAPIYALLPEWAQSKNLETMLERVKTPGTKPLIKKDMKDINPDTICINSAQKHPYLVGKTLSEISENIQKPPHDALLHIMDVTNLRATVSIKNLNPRSILPLLGNSRTLLTAYMAGLPSTSFSEPEQAKTVFPDFLKQVIASKALKLEKAIEYLTSKPAGIFGIPKRGIIKEGNAADLVIISKNDYSIKDVIIGGNVVGEETHRGKVLKHE